MIPGQERRAAELVGRGYTQAEVARRLDVSVRTVRRALAKPAVSAVAAEARRQVDPSAADVLRELLGSDREEIRLRAAIALLTKAPSDPEVPGSPVAVVEVFGGDIPEASAT